MSSFRDREIRLQVVCRYSPSAKPIITRKKKQYHVYPGENSCLRCSTPTSAQTILDAIFESDDEEHVLVSKRRRMLSGSDSEESDEDDGPFASLLDERVTNQRAEFFAPRNPFHSIERFEDP